MNQNIIKSNLMNYVNLFSLFSQPEVIMMKTILYIGAFDLPDNNAAAHRVMNNAKCFSVLNKNTIFLDMQKSDFVNQHEKYNDEIEVYHRKYPTTLFEYLKYGFSIKEAKKIIQSRSEIDTIIVYNVFSLVFLRLLVYCKLNKLKIISDCTEWYTASKYNIIKKIDIFIRMNFLNNMCDGIIVISSYLENYYKSNILVKIPPLIDEDENVWAINQSSKSKDIVFSYCGIPGRKERLDLFINVISGEKYQGIDFDFYIAGITLDEFCSIYTDVNRSLFSKKIHFLGKVSHEKSLEIMRKSDFGIIIRESTRTNNAGFPTKYVEYTTLGVPVIASNISDLSDYVTNNDILLDEISYASISNALDLAFEKGKRKNLEKRNIFSYKKYIDHFREFFDLIESNI